MKSIRPVSDLRNNFADISRTVHEEGRPIILTKNGRADMVVMSMDAFEDLQFMTEIQVKIEEAEREAEMTSKRYSTEEVRELIKKAAATGASHAK